MRLLFLISIVALLLTACGGEGASGPTATRFASRTPTPAQPTGTATPRPTRSPAAPPAEPTDTSAPSQPTEPPTNTPTRPPTDTPLPEPTDTPPPVAGGRISFRDNLAVADQLSLTMQGIAPPPEGSVYEGWLIADDGVREISTGVFEVGADGNVDYTWTSPTGENLIANYASFAVTVEPQDDSDPAPSNQVVFRGAADADSLAAARRVFAVNDGEPATPRNVPYGQGLMTQSQVAKDHVLNAFNAAAIGAYGEMRIHAEHVINIIAGTSGPRFADYTGDGRAENPGDGFGTLNYARQIALLLPAVSDDLPPLEQLLIAIQDHAEEILAAPDISTAQPTLDEFKGLGEQLLNQAAPAFYAVAQDAVGYPITPTP